MRQNISGALFFALHAIVPSFSRLWVAQRFSAAVNGLPLTPASAAEVRLPGASVQLGSPEIWPWSSYRSYLLG